MSDLFEQTVLPMFEQNRESFLAAARRLALEIARQRDGGPVTINDLRHAGLEPPEDIDPRVMGGVFAGRDWVCVGYVGSRRKTCHGRPVAQFVLRG